MRAKGTSWAGQTTNLKPYNNQNNSTDNLQKNIQMIHTDISASILARLSNLNENITRTD